MKLYFPVFLVVFVSCYRLCVMNFFQHNTQDNVCNPNFECVCCFFLFYFSFIPLFMWILCYDVSDKHTHNFLLYFFNTSFLVTLRIVFKDNSRPRQKSICFSFVTNMKKLNNTRTSVFNRHRICATEILRNIIIWHKFSTIGLFKVCGMCLKMVLGYILTFIHPKRDFCLCVIISGSNKGHLSNKLFLKWKIV